MLGGGGGGSVASQLLHHPPPWETEPAGKTRQRRGCISQWRCGCTSLSRVHPAWGWDGPLQCWGHHEACGDREGQALPAPLSQPQPGGQLPLRHSEHPHFPLPQRLPLLMEETFRCPTASGAVPFQGCCDTGMAWSSPVTARCQRSSGTGAGSEGCEPTLEPRQSLPSLLVS